MSDAGQDLNALFPGKQEAIARLKSGNAHFETLNDRYHELVKAIHRIETEVEPASDDYLEQLKKERLSLLDRIAAMLAGA